MFSFGISQAANASCSHPQPVCFQESVQLSWGTRGYEGRCKLK